jgi:tRNA splicing endonuclease
LTLAIWIMDSGAKVGKGLKFSTNFYTYKDCEILVKVLKNNFIYVKNRWKILKK